MPVTTSQYFFLIFCTQGSKIRYDERSYGEIRKFEASSSFLPIVHGSSQVQFGETNVMSVATLGGRSSSLKVYPYVGQAFEKTFFVHHTFPPYALNKIGRIRENRLAIGQLLRSLYELNNK